MTIATDRRMTLPEYLNYDDATATRISRYLEGAFNPEIDRI